MSTLVQEIIHAAGVPEPPADALDWLHPVPRQILSSLRRTRADRRAAVRALNEETTEARTRVQRQAGHIQRLLSHEGDGYRLVPGDERVVAAEQELERMRAELAELVAVEKDRRARPSSNRRDDTAMRLC